MLGTPDGDDGDLVFCHPDGRPYHPNTLPWMFDQHLKRHRLPRIRLHNHDYADLRVMPTQLDAA